MHGMGFSDQHQWVCVLHNDHVHFLANRVGLDGSVFLGRNENLKSTALIQRLEQVHGLTVTKGPKRTTKGRIATPDQRKTRVGERRRYERLEEMPPRERLQQLVDDAAKGRPTAAEFVTRLQARGVSVWPKFTGEHLDGFSFGLGKIAFTGQQLGDKFRWGRLKKAGVSYDPTRDMDALLAARPADSAALAEAVVQVEAEPTASAPEGLEESLVEREDWMTDEDYANAVMIEKERIVFEAELEEIQTALDSPEPGQKVQGLGV